MLVIPLREQSVKTLFNYSSFIYVDTNSMASISNYLYFLFVDLILKIEWSLLIIQLNESFCFNIEFLLQQEFIYNRCENVELK